MWDVCSFAWVGLPLNIDTRARNLFNTAVNFELGNGQTIMFWKDPWLGDQALDMSLPGEGLSFALLDVEASFIINSSNLSNLLSDLSPMDSTCF